MLLPAGWRPAAFNQGWSYRERIPDQQSAILLSSWLAKRYRHSSLQEWQQRIAAQELDLNDRPLLSDAVISPGDRICWHRPAWLEPAIPDRWDTIHDDGDVLVINKPSGLPVVPGGGFLRHTLTALLEPTGARPVHRLGRFTSGLQVCARTPASRAALSRRFRPGGGCRKIYRALSRQLELLHPGQQRAVTTDVVERQHPLLDWIWGPEPPDPTTPTRRRLSAHSSLLLLERRHAGDLLEVAITTGRPHQIRIHLAQLGSPLLGDPLYRADRSIDPSATPGDGGYRLHASGLEMAEAAFHCPADDLQPMH